MNMILNNNLLVQTVYQNVNYYSGRPALNDKIMICHYEISTYIAKLFVRIFNKQVHRTHIH